MFPHLRDVEGRKVVVHGERNVGNLGLIRARAKVPGNLPRV